MLSIGKLGGGQERYYLDKVAEGAEDYYSGEGEAEGYWLGDAADELGLDGMAEPDQLIAMLTGVNPATGEPLGLRHVAGRGPVPGFDLTFSAPKSVSLTWALGGADAGAEVAAAHASAVKAALDYLQPSARRAGRGSDDSSVSALASQVTPSLSASRRNASTSSTARSCHAAPKRSNIAATLEPGSDLSGLAVSPSHWRTHWRTTYFRTFDQER